MSELEPGTVVDGRYEILDAIGSGGLGTVYRARDVNDDATVALKMLNIVGDEAQRRFLREFNILSRIRHARIVRSHRWGLHAGKPYFSMDYIQGRPLSDLIASAEDLKRLRTAWLLPLIRQIGEGLAYIHEQGLVHCDLKPSNIMITDVDGERHFTILDLGLARFRDSKEQRVKPSRATSGTVEYMSPEQIRGRLTDQRSDLYSLGVILYEILTGNPPFSGENPASVMFQHLRDRPRPTASFASEAISLIEESILKLLEKEPIDRYDSVWSLLHDLADSEDGIDGNEIGSPLTSTRQAPFLQSQFVGREREMRTLKGIVADAGRGTERMILVSGEAGIGKTQVLDEFQADARVHGMRVLSGRCCESGGRPFAPFLEALHDLVEQQGTLGSELEASAKRIIAQIKCPRPRYQTNPYPVIEILSEFIHELSKEAPTLVCIEDLQWADDLTLRFLEFMWSDPNRIPIVFCLACRKKDRHSLPARIEAVFGKENPPRLLHLQLEPLDFDATSHLVASIIGRNAVPLAEARRIHEETGGNPLFVVELIRGSIEDGSIWRDSAGCWRWPERTEWSIPSEITQVIESRIGRLDSQQREALEYASILRGAFAFDLMARLWCADEWGLYENLEHLVRLGLLRSLDDLEGGYRFSHGLIQRAVYQGISEKKRQMLHLKTGRALERPYESDRGETLDDLAYHFSRSNDLAKMTQYVTAFGRVALQMQDFSKAREQFEVVLESGAFSDGAAGNLSLGSILHLDFLCCYAEALSGCGKFEQARIELQKAIEWVTAETPAQKAYALKMLGINYCHSEDYQMAESMLSDALDLFCILGDNENELTTLGLLSDVCLRLRNEDEAVKYCRSAVEKCRELGGTFYEARALIFLAFEAENTSRLDDAKSHLENSLNLLECVGDRFYRYVCLYLLARIDFQLGDFERSKATLNELRAYWRRTGAKTSEAEAHLYLGRIALEEGKTKRAEAHGRAAERLVAGRGHRDKLVMARALIAETLAETNRIDEALTYSELASSNGEVSGDLRAITCTARTKALAAAGMHQEVELLLREALRGESAPNGLYQIYLFLTAGAYYGKRGRATDARVYLENGKALCEEMGMRYFARKAADLLDMVSAEVDGSSSDGSLGPTLSRKHFVTLYEVSEQLTSELDLNKLLDRIMDQLIELSKGERALIAIKADAASGVELARAYQLDDTTAREISQGVVREAMKKNKPVLSHNAQVDERFGKRKSVLDYGIQSVLCIPLSHVRLGVIGALYIDHRKIENLFNEDDRDFLAAFANMVSVAVINAQMYSEIKERALYLQKQFKDGFRMEELVGESQAMQEVFKLLTHAAESNVTVLIQGETGTGKELAAKAIHARSSRKSKPFLSANCAALTHELLQSELFGHKKGAFTGAASDRKGLFASADGGTVFLDEIGNASPQLQSSLLRVLQEGEIQRVGEAGVRNVDVRVIAATNRDLESDVRNGLFREDLYYRLRVLQIEMPPIRSHIEDVPLLSEYLLKRVCDDENKSIHGFTVGAMRKLMDYSWPGNVRELENEIRRAAALVEEGKEITADLFSEKIGVLRQMETGGRSYFKSRIAALERWMILDALDQCADNITRAADLLGISRNGLQKMMSRHALR